MSARLVLAAAAALLVASAPAGAADRVVERGIVQSIDPSAIVIRALDGTMSRSASVLRRASGSTGAR